MDTDRLMIVVLFVSFAIGVVFAAVPTLRRFLIYAVVTPMAMYVGGLVSFAALYSFDEGVAHSDAFVAAFSFSGGLLAAIICNTLIARNLKKIDSRSP